MAYAKKSLGQNFLHFPKATNRIVEIVREKKIPIIIEIGPGKGALTGPLLEKTDVTIYAVELDPRMCDILTEKFSEYIASKRLIIVHQDILEKDARDIIGNTTYGLVGNVPFYITGAIIKKFLTESCQPDYMTLITQKEVADRIVKRDSKESILSLSVQIFGTPKYEMKIPRKYFTPAPNVDAALFSIHDISRKNLTDISEERFFELVRLGFAHKRKKLASNIKGFFAEPISDIFERHNLDNNIRAEEVSLATWVRLAAEK